MYLGMFYGSGGILLIIGFAFTLFAQLKVSKTFSKYLKIGSRNGITGSEAARIILDRNGLSNIPIEMINGKLSDHYDPSKRIMRLSRAVYLGNSIAAVSVAAHESGHAIQHKEKYGALTFRSALARPASITSMGSWILLIVGILISNMGMITEGNLLFNLGIIFFVVVVVFHLVTLPVELNASKRALDQLVSNNIVCQEESLMSKKVLSAAALTYIAALAMAVLQLLRLIIISRGR